MEQISDVVHSAVKTADGLNELVQDLEGQIAKFQLEAPAKIY